jgi:8-hydroxy-5-deazaflavin:NADPH oxidoreductase
MACAPVAGGMKIAVIGTGNIGGSIGSRWLKAGYEVVFGSRGTSRPGPGGAPVLAVGAALEGADVVLLAVPGPAVPDVIGTHREALAGKVVIDAVNRIGQPEFNSRSLLPDARYVRAFNTLGWENFADPLPGTSLFFAADPAARPVAEELISAVGLDPVFLGDAGASGTVDSLVSVWFALVQQHGGNRRIALRAVQEG